MAEEPQEVNIQPGYLLKSAGIKNIRWKRSVLPIYETSVALLAPFRFESPKVEFAVPLIGKLFPMRMCATAKSLLASSMAKSKCSSVAPNGLHRKAHQNPIPQHLAKDLLCLRAIPVIEKLFDSLFFAKPSDQTSWFACCRQRSHGDLCTKNSRFVISKEPGTDLDLFLLHRLVRDAATWSFPQIGASMRPFGGFGFKIALIVLIAR